MEKSLGGRPTINELGLQSLPAPGLAEEGVAITCKVTKMESAPVMASVLNGPYFAAPQMSQMSQMSHFGDLFLCRVIV